MPRDRRRPSAPRCVVRIRRLDPVGVAMFIPHLTDLLPSLTGSTAATRNAAVLQRCVPNVQAFIRRASSMADKTSWTKPLACMTYGDSIVGRARVSLGTVYPATTVRCSSGWPGTRTAAAVAARACSASRRSTAGPPTRVSTRRAGCSGRSSRSKAFVRDFVSAWNKVMNLDRFDLASYRRKGVRRS
jgi:hypothetical protein